MNLEVTPYSLIVVLVCGALTLAAWYSVYKGRMKTAIAVVVACLVFMWAAPVRMTVDTDAVNARADQQIMRQHKENLKELPPRIVVEEESYEEMLRRKEKEIAAPTE